MPINNITQTMSTISPPPHRGVDVQTVFVNKQEDFQDHLADITIDELNTLKDQLNTRIGEINSTATTMNGYADTASAGASTATTKAGEASTSASGALTSRNQAETFKNNASTSASTATTKASEASASALSASTSASTATTKAGEASASASTATTKASEASASALSASTSASTATTKASEASASALSASTSASTATTKASEASASASQALTSRNQAETFAQQAQASAESVDANNIVHRTGAETIAGVKTFSSSPIVPTPTTSTQAANKAYVDSASGGAWSANDTRAKTALNASGDAPIYACRAWVNFNGTGTVAIRASGNVSSITDNGVGDYTVNFTTAMVYANYSAQANNMSNVSSYAYQVYFTSYTSSACRVNSGYYTTGNNVADIVDMSVSIFR